MNAGAQNTPYRCGASSIYVFVPNIIGYARIFLSLYAFAIAKSSPLLFLVCYIGSFALDALDGMAARALQQCSHFGAILDMLVDRASTTGLLVVLCGILQPSQHWCTCVLAYLAFLDVGSHFCRMYVSIFLGAQSHKDVSQSVFGLLRWYYSCRNFMGVLCVGQEFAYLTLYAHHSYADVPVLGSVLWMAFAICAVPCALKQVVNVQQLLDGLYHLAQRDAALRSSGKTD